jgi:hypothetical protein
MPKDATTYPNFTDTLSAAMGTEVLSLWENTAFSSDSSALDLFTTQKTFANKELGGLYGIDTSSLTTSAFSPELAAACSWRQARLPVMRGPRARTALQEPLVAA